MNEIINQIYDLLSAVENIQSVYKYNKPNLGGFPVALIIGADIEKEDVSVKSVLKKYRIKIKICQEITDDNRGHEEGDKLLVDLSGEIEDIFDNNFTINNTVDNSNIRNISFDYAEEGVIMRVLNIDLECIKLKKLS